MAALLLPAFLLGQRGRPPRRIPNPSTILLKGGSRVEFKTFYSPAIGETTRYSVLLPPSYDKNLKRAFPVVYFLHGLFNDDTSWCVDRYGNLPALIEQIIQSEQVPEFLMVHPNGENSFYTDYADGSKKFEEYVRKDLIAEVEAHFRVKKERENRAIGGTSMGGYGALKIAMKFPRLYASVAAGSPIILLGEDPSAQLTTGSTRTSQFFSRIFAAVFGQPLDREHWKKNSIELLAQSAPLTNLNICMLYGTADRYNGLVPMEKGIRRVDGILKRRGVPHQLKVYEGEPHGWALMSKHLKQTLQFLTQTF